MKYFITSLKEKNRSNLAYFYMCMEKTHTIFEILDLNICNFAVVSLIKIFQ